ncbi:F-box/FBD/LRR-repeat protein At1g13570-like [Actinidia eriantha]|uniref:F-box/FBD/LRR-repeat protein At1g13570-like n=1 Tax=Actinidia eriantha TaxID=165200 RepID=UPI0025877E5B|nr:F-box/FBD/LRR-repeat protein At1g13570-like [Actinidia eriantha]
MEDRLSELPDEILGIILSSLKVKEAARTCVLSHRWKYMWTLFSGCLDFDYSDVVYELRDIQAGHGTLDVARRNFLLRVNRVVEWHQGPAIDEFSICFDLDIGSSKCDIDRWIKFAMEKRVQRFKLDFTGAFRYSTKGLYSFPPHSLDVSGFNSLTSLSLNIVDVTGDVIESIISNCPSLEELCVCHIGCIENLNISGPSLKLRHLEIKHCHPLQNLKISASKLVSFKYFGRVGCMPLKNAPALNVAHFGSFFCEHVVRNFGLLSDYISQLETLCLDLWHRGSDYYNPIKFRRLPTLTNLKQLELKLDVFSADTLFSCTSLIRSSPSLHRFALQLFWPRHQVERGQWALNPKKHPHRCLKVVEIIGFDGCSVDIELARYLLNNALSLERMTIDPRSHYRMDFTKIEEKNAIRERARQLESEFPPGAELVIF